MLHGGIFEISVNVCYEKPHNGEMKLEDCVAYSVFKQK